MQQIVSKFGGTSVSSRETWNNILLITRKHLAAGLQPIIVCSARSQASNELELMVEAAKTNSHQSLQSTFIAKTLELARALDLKEDLIAKETAELDQWLTGIALLREAPFKTHAQILSLGELMLTRLGHAFLSLQGLNCLWFDAREALTAQAQSGDDRQRYCNARVAADINPNLSEQLLNSGAEVIITQGFIAANTMGETVLLGRGGSDTSAALFAAILDASACEIWTDVPGIYTANPHQLPHARLLKVLNYEEAQEIASMGAKVLHPLCIPPVRKANIPMYVKHTCMPEHSGTLIFNKTEDAPLIKSIQVKPSISLISIDTVSMWQKVGFLAEVFNVFKQHQLSIDLMASSESNITLSLDDQHGKAIPRTKIKALEADLHPFGRVKIIEPCSAVSLVGHHIRRALPQLGSALEVFDDQQVHLMSLASNDLNLTFVVDESKAEKLCQTLHSLLIESNPQNFYYSKSWHEEFGNPEPKSLNWWEKHRDDLLTLGANHSPCYVYDTETIREQVKALRSLKSIDSIFYSLKANPHPDILKTLAAQGLGFECVSTEELDRVLSLFPDLPAERVLFTPNFASKAELAHALSKACTLTLDSLYPLEQWPELFAKRDIFVRIDPGIGAGHHKFVCTGGNESKFGISTADLDKLLQLTEEHQVNVIGLHTHSGSGILSPELWQETAEILAREQQRFPNLKVINLGGGFGISEKPGQTKFDLKALDELLLAVKSRYPKLQFWLEPGRFFVAESGIILAKVTQVKQKGKVRFVGIETGMNSLIRPMLYGAYHPIVNLSRLTENLTQSAHIVGPICESGDTLGYDRMMPDTFEGDLVLIANTGAYGHCMSSSYNLRKAAEEIIWPLFDAH